MKEALVIQAARFGDLLQLRRLVESLQRDSRVHLVADSSFSQLVSHLYPDVIFHSAAFHSAPAIEAMKRNRQLFSDLQGIEFTRIYNCNYSPLTAAIMRLFDEDRVIGYRPAHVTEGGQFASPWARLGFRLSSLRAASPLNLVDFWAWFTDNPIAPETVNPEARAGGRGIGIAMAGREQRRSLPAEVLAPLAKTAFQILGKPEIRLFGTDKELNAANRILRFFTPEMQKKTLNLCGKTNWEQLITEMRNLDLLLTPDTGLMHLAAFLGAPIAAFFLSSAWCHETGPYGRGHLVFQSACKCSPCLESATCGNGLACHKPFQEAEFQSFFGRVLSGSNRPGAPAGIQLWKTSLDKLGALPKLAAGEDAYSQERQDTRQILLTLKNLDSEWDPVSPIYKNLLDRLFPESEWMLPPWRYC